MLKANHSLRCLAGFDERSATTGLKKRPDINMAAVENLGQCIQVRSSKSPWWEESV